jgi:hypothetical protein
MLEILAVIQFKPSPGVSAQNASSSRLRESPSPDLGHASVGSVNRLECVGALFKFLTCNAFIGVCAHAKHLHPSWLFLKDV